MEEWVGVKWHHYITAKSLPAYPESRVCLVDIKRPLAIFFRALGGDKGISIGHTTAQLFDGHRSWLQKISGAAKRFERAHFSRDHLYLPEHIDYFDNRQSNLDVYYWLTALASHNQLPHPQHLLAHNLHLTQKTLRQWPGLKKRYHNLIQQHLPQRPHLKQLPSAYQQHELLIKNVLKNVEHTQAIPEVSEQNLPAMVPVWLYPSPEVILRHGNKQAFPQAKGSSEAKAQKQKSKRYSAEQVASTDNKDGLLSFRLESLFSWSEFINLDRSEEDGDDDNEALKAADDLDKLSIGQGETGHKIKLDLDLPAAEYDDEVLEKGILMPEWQHKKQQLVNDYCSLQLMQITASESVTWPHQLQRQAQQLKRQFEALKPQRQWLNQQTDGEEPDLLSFIDYTADKRAGRSNTDPKLYRNLQHKQRDLCSLILTDLSLSTDAYINDEKKVIDVIRDALYLFSESLDAAQERFAIAGFASRKRSHVRYYPIKRFDQKYDDLIRGRIHAIQPSYYTRMGTAIRYATQALLEEKSKQKLLLILTDGKPNDLDQYEGRYGLEDTKMAVKEAKQKGIVPFCVSIDHEAYDYLPYIFGSQSFFHIKNAAELPRKLPQLYLHLIS
ncbi:nitric oxide reductase activation protein NorD [Marinicella litoralis]|uniref:Nitric oxide reductase NorD protein n=1 Tax=Marinicella litoralis TaxID=644220 RepID=A0A4R6XUA3_9GAMM|nr:VWA domain-containing protein [Marinicella litoralis]TDR23386.1 nitric oxide reductase NorD protein [Marinicella litoralis]